MDKTKAASSRSDSESGQSDFTLDDVDIVFSSGRRYCGSDLGNLLSNGGPNHVANRLTELAEIASPPLRGALLKLAQQVTPGPTPHRLAAQCAMRPHRLPRCGEPDRVAEGPRLLSLQSEPRARARRNHRAAPRPVLRLVRHETART
jgi:hypothetical protein